MGFRRPHYDGADSPKKVEDSKVLNLNTVDRDLPFHLTECINQMDLESQLPHEIVRFLFLTNQNSTLTVLWGG